MSFLVWITAAQVEKPFRQVAEGFPTQSGQGAVCRGLSWGAGERGEQVLRPWLVIEQRKSWDLTTYQTRDPYSTVDSAQFHPTSLPSLQTCCPCICPHGTTVCRVVHALILPPCACSLDFCLRDAHRSVHPSFFPFWASILPSGSLLTCSLLS